jgi:tricorn protease-like protein
MLFQPDICEDNNLSLYVDLINSIQINKEKVFIVLTPHYMDFATSIDYEGFNWFYEMMEELIKSTDIRFLDYSNLKIVQDKEYFNDFVHLNQNGSEVFTKHFVESLLKHG